VLERLEPLGGLLLHVGRRATVIMADSASWNRRILTPSSIQARRPVEALRAG
jgi:hypothetical protein